LEQISLGSINWVRAETGGLSPRHIMRMSAEGKFPKPVRVTEGSENRKGRIAFVKSEVRAWIAARIAERDAKIAASNPSGASTGLTPQPPPHRGDARPVGRSRRVAQASH
jgi:predicted DNA-binding transcriptional regulator AlpA